MVILIYYQHFSQFPPPLSLTQNHFMMDRVLEKDREIELVEHDVNYICSSSHDPRYPPSAKLLVPHGKQLGWVSTGLLPQVCEALSLRRQ